MSFIDRDNLQIMEQMIVATCILAQLKKNNCAKLMILK